MGCEHQRRINCERSKAIQIVGDFLVVIAVCAAHNKKRYNNIVIADLMRKLFDCFKRFCVCRRNFACLFAFKQLNFNIFVFDNLAYMLLDVLKCCARELTEIYSHRRILRQNICGGACLKHSAGCCCSYKCCGRRKRFHNSEINRLQNF